MVHRAAGTAARAAGALLVAATLSCDGAGLPLDAAVAACDLVTAADLESVIGASTPAGSETKGADGVTTCQYNASEGSHSVLIRVSPQVGDQEHAEFPFAEPRAVPGLGDKATFAERAATARDPAGFDPGSALSALSGKVEVSIYYQGTGDRLGISKALAERALGRL